MLGQTCDGTKLLDALPPEPTGFPRQGEWNNATTDSEIHAQMCNLLP